LGILKFGDVLTSSDFFSKYLSSAQRASASSGIPALLILAQAALESGYGKSASGNNFFGIKAGKKWNGKTQTIPTHEYVNGVRVAINATFRAYDSPEESFSDWADFIKSNSRYKSVLSASDTISAAKALQKAGYSTSPIYADQLITVAHKLSPDAIPLTTYAESLAKVLAVAGGKVVSTTAKPAGITMLLAFCGLGMYFLLKSGVTGHPNQ
jgi:flagellum-specific peptidoglycan hydrolase FlgJ